MSTWISDVDGKTSTFPSKALKLCSFAVFSLQISVAFPHPFGFLKQAGRSQLLAAGPFVGNVTSIR